MGVNGMDRRQFLKGSALTAAGVGLSVATGPVTRNVLGANEKVIVGVIGTGGQGRGNMSFFMKDPRVEIAAVCDVYGPNLDKALALTDGKAKPYKDFRHVLDRKDIDAVLISTPDHWHALMTVWACNAGKDVYVEKPLALTIKEGRKMVEAARRNNCVVQVGTQQRSGAHFQRAVEIVRSGMLGKISMVKTWNAGNAYPEGIGNPPDSDPPPELDWDMWLGPAPKVPYNKNRGLYTFRWFWDYSGGMLTDWGTHLIDIVHWAMDVDAPTSVANVGGKWYIQDNRETPDTIQAVFEYPGFVLTYAYSLLNSRGIDNHGYGIEFHGTDGTLFLDRSGWEIMPEMKKAGKDGRETTAKIPVLRSGSSEQNLPHVKNFLDCIKSRQRPISDVEIGHRSTAAPHLANIAMRTRQRLEWDANREEITNYSEANQWLSKEYRKPWKLD